LDVDLELKDFVCIFLRLDLLGYLERFWIKTSLE